VSEEVLEAIVLTEGIEEVGPLDFAVVDCVDEFVVVEGLCDEQGDEGVGREDLVEEYALSILSTRLRMWDASSGGGLFSRKMAR
jgi:hypothetical protein